MLSKTDLGKIISDRYTLRDGKRIPQYLGVWITDYVFEAIKIGLIEDGYVNLRNLVSIKRIDIPEHKKKMPSGEIITVPLKSKIKVEFASKFMEDINNGEIKETVKYGN